MSAQPLLKVADMTHRDSIQRRHLLVLGGAGLATLALVACGQDKKDTPAKTSKSSAPGGTGCKAPVDANSKQMRSTLKYVDKTADEKKRCDNCAQYEAGKHGDCGGCKLFTGPVQPGGYCMSWAAKPDAAQPDAAPSASSTAG